MDSRQSTVSLQPISQASDLVRIEKQLLLLFTAVSGLVHCIPAPGERLILQVVFSSLGRP